MTTLFLTDSDTRVVIEETSTQVIVNDPTIGQDLSLQTDTFIVAVAAENPPSGGSGGSGETNTAANLGAGEGIYASKSNAVLQFKSLIGGTNVTLASDAGAITINAAGGGGGSSAWGDLTGALSDQTDLQAALDGKAGTGDVFSGAYGDLTGTPTIPTNNTQLTNGAGFITSYTVTQGDVTSHQAALSITESQISDLGAYITGYTVTQGDVTAHQGALSLTVSQISDFGSYQPLNSVLTNTTESFTSALKTKLDGIEASATADQTASEIETAYNTQVSQVSAGEITAGTETAVRRYSPADLAAIVAAHESGGGGGGGGTTCMKVFFEGQNDLNNSTSYTTMNMSDSGVVGTIAGASVSEANDELTLPAGNYKTNLFVNLSSGTARTNVNFRMTIDDVEYQEYFGGNYIRNLNGHSSAGNAFPDYFELASSATIAFGGAREAQTGTVTLATSSFFTVEKVG